MIESIKLSRQKDIDSYKPSTSLEKTIEMAIALGRPLLLAGKPGTGKTQFGHWFVNKRNDFNEVFQFNTKSTSLFNDLFYEYDAVSHFRDKEGLKEITDFITLTAFGKAILCAKGFNSITDPRLLKIAKNSDLDLEKVAPKSLVLIDEIDKAPRDFPNDLLHEIENISFTIKETSPIIKVELNDIQKENIVIILTSNDEKNLPDAFLRRCLFHYIEFPKEIELKKIILNKLNEEELTEDEIKKIEDAEELEGFNGLNNKIEFFYKIFLSNSIEKKPHTSECIDWINYLKKNNLLHLPIKEYKDTLSVLLKKDEDFKEALKMLD